MCAGEVHESRVHESLFAQTGHLEAAATNIERKKRMNSTKVRLTLDSLSAGESPNNSSSVRCAVSARLEVGTRFGCFRNANPN